MLWEYFSSRRISRLSLGPAVKRPGNMAAECETMVEHYNRTFDNIEAQLYRQGSKTSPVSRKPIGAVRHSIGLSFSPFSRACSECCDDISSACDTSRPPHAAARRKRNRRGARGGHRSVVVEPTGNGLGSDAFCILWDGAELHGLNASGRSSSQWSPERFAQCRRCLCGDGNWLPFRALSPRGSTSLGVSGGWLSPTSSYPRSSTPSGDFT